MPGFAVILLTKDLISLCRQVMYDRLFQRERYLSSKDTEKKVRLFDVVDLDPYGSPSIFLDSADQVCEDVFIFFCLVIYYCF